MVAYSRFGSEKREGFSILEAVLEACAEQMLLWLLACEAKTDKHRDRDARRRKARALDSRLGTKMVDLRRMTSLLRASPLRPPVGWASWVVVAASLAQAAEAADDCRSLVEVERNMEEGSNWMIYVTLLIAVLGGIGIGLLCGHVWSRLGPREASRTRHMEAATQTEEFEIHPYWDSLLSDLSKELEQRGERAPRLKRDIVHKLLEVDASRLLRPAHWRRLLRRSRM